MSQSVVPSLAARDPLRHYTRAEIDERYRAHLKAAGAATRQQRAARRRPSPTVPLRLR
jgi:hypothetical protein